MRFALLSVVCACGVGPDPAPFEDTAGPAAEPIPVVLSDSWLVYPGSSTVSLGPHDGAPPMLIESALRPDDLYVRVQAEIDLYPARLLRERIDAVVVGTQLSDSDGKHYRGVADPEYRLVFLSAEDMTLTQLPRTLHHEIGHVLYWLLSREDRAQWKWLSNWGDPRSFLGRPRAEKEPSEDFAAYVSAARTRADWLQAKACKVPDTAEKADFVYKVVTALGVDLERSVDLDWCVSYGD